jgi:small subunit ribosomal protein S7
MSRSTFLRKTNIILDLEYNSFLIHLLTQKILKSGKQLLAKRIIYKTCLFIEEQTKKNALKIFEEAIINAKPIMELKKLATNKFKEMPVEISSFRGILLAIRYILKNIDLKRPYPFTLKLANSIILTSKGVGNAVKYRKESLALAKATKFLTFYNV